MVTLITRDRKLLTVSNAIVKKQIISLPNPQTSYNTSREGCLVYGKKVAIALVGQLAALFGANTWNLNLLLG